jgi:hypothetical protein
MILRGKLEQPARRDVWPFTIVLALSAVPVWLLAMT